MGNVFSMKWPLRVRCLCKGRDISCDQEGIGWEGWKFFNKIKNLFVSLMCDGRLLPRGWMKWVI